MSEVYECLDLTLRLPVAVKLLRSRLGRSPVAAELLCREVLLARRVTHPNVCRIFELFVDGHEGGLPTPAVVMELLRGRTLAAALHDRRMSFADGAAVLRAVAAGLAAVHAAGVVHRDLKPANVFLVGHPPHGRPVLTDFGIAIETAERPPGTYGPAGTPPYVAPEVCAGAPASYASDVYAFGILMAEVLSGRPAAIVGELGATGLEQHLRRASVPARWRRVLTRCLAPDPARRPASGTQLVAAFERPKIRSPLSKAMAATLIVATIGAGALALKLAAPRIRHLPPTLSSRDPLPERPAIAFALESRSTRASDRELTATLSQLLEWDLEEGGQALVKPSSEIRTVVDVRDGNSPAALRRVAQALDCDAIVAGTVLGPDQGSLQVELFLVSRDASRPAASIRRAVRTADLFAAADSLATELRRLAGLPPPTKGDRSPVLALRSVSPAAQIAYGRGWDYLQRDEFRAARAAFEAALHEDPAYAMAEYGLAEVSWRQGDQAATAAAATRALVKGRRLPRPRQLAIEALLHAGRGEWKPAQAAYAALSQLYPDDLSYGFALGELQLAASDLKGAAQTIAALRLLDHAKGNPLDRARIDLLDAEVAHLNGDLDRWRKTAEQARTELANQPAAESLRARANALLGRALLAAGDVEGAKGRLHEAERTFIGVEDPDRLGQTLNSLGKIALVEGHHQEAVDLHQRALALFRSIGSNRGLVSTYLALSMAFEQPQVVKAEALLRQALQVALQTGDHGLEGMTRNNFGVFLVARGKYREGTEELSRALELAKITQDPDVIAVQQGNLANLFGFQGRRLEAIRLWKAAAQRLDSAKIPLFIAFAKSCSAKVALAEGDLARAIPLLRAAHQAGGKTADADVEAATAGDLLTAVSLGGEPTDSPAFAAGLEELSKRSLLTGSLNAIGGLELAKADSALLQNRFADADRSAQRAAKTLRGLPLVDSAAHAEIISAVALANLGDRVAARTALARAKKLLPKERLDLQMSAELAEFEIDCPASPVRVSKQALALADTSRERGFYRTSFEARILAARCSLEAGDRRTARNLAAPTRMEAGRTGWRLFAREATAIESQASLRITPRPGS